MQKGFGIAAIAIAIVSIFIPLFGAWICILTALLAILTYGPGFALGLATIIINTINIFFLSPTALIAISTNSLSGKILIGSQVTSLIILIALNHLTKESEEKTPKQVVHSSVKENCIHCHEPLIDNFKKCKSCGGLQ